MMRYTLAGFATLGTLQSRVVEVAGESATVDATRTFAAAARHVAIEGAGGILAATREPLVAATRHVAVEGAGGTIVATREPLVAADRIAEVEVPLEVWLDAQAYRVAAPSYLVPGARRFGLSRFATLGTLQSRHMAVEGLGGYLAGRSYAVPDISGGVVVVFEEVSGGVSVAFEEVSGGVVVVFEEVYPI